MTISHQQYAALADDSYNDRPVGPRTPANRELELIGGAQYVVLDHVNSKKTGYQGTIYQRVDTGEIVVAHRGTEGEKQPVLDGLLADGSMVANRTNPQVPDAIDLTRRAMQYAAVHGKETGHTPQVTVTGHSLGGALAQVSAHHFGLKGETFNAYGAASLDYRVPEGGNAMINHVMAGDFVSAASGHYGQVRIYATEAEITRMQVGGFSNSRLNSVIPDQPVAVAIASVGSHSMHNFLAEDGKGRPDKSVLSDPATFERAERNQRMIEEYRNDVRGIRTGATLMMRSPNGLVEDAVDAIRGPLQPGEPARREQQRNGQDHSSLRIDDPRHGGHSLFQDAERGVHAMDAKAGRTPDQQSRQLAGALAAEMHAAGGRRIDAVVMSTDAERTFGVQGRMDDPAHLRVHVPTMAAMRQSLDDSTQRIDQSITQQQALAQSQSTERLQERNARTLA